MEKPKKRKRWIWLIVILVVVIGGAIWLIRSLAAQASAMAALLANNEQTYTVERGSLDKTITASGILSAPDTELVKLPDGLLIDEVLVKVGDAVKAGDPLARLDTKSVAEQLAYVTKKLDEEDNRIATASTLDSIKAPAKGRVKYQPVAEGDDVRVAMEQYGVLALLSVDGWMRLEIPTDKTLELGERMEVVWDGGKAKGTVDQKTADGYVILVPDSHAPYLGKATLMDGDTEIGSGTLYINMPLEVCGSDGTIRTIRYHLDESVPDGREMFALKNPSVNTSFASRYATRTKIADLYKRMVAFSGNPTLLAPCDGVISEISLTAGKLSGTAVNADSESVAMQMSAGGATILTVDVDELDILMVDLGQTAEVTLDAMSGETMTGEVVRISAAGKKESSISTFPVEIKLSYAGRLMAGMNGTATILAERVENVLVIPVAAIDEDETGEYVTVVLPDGSKARTAITSGVSDGDMAEVTSGLKEGDVISYTEIKDFSFGSMGMAVSVG